MQLETTSRPWDLNSERHRSYGNPHIAAAAHTLFQSKKHTMCDTIAAISPRFEAERAPFRMNPSHIVAFLLDFVTHRVFSAFAKLNAANRTDTTGRMDKAAKSNTEGKANVTVRTHAAAEMNAAIRIGIAVGMHAAIGREATAGDTSASMMRTERRKCATRAEQRGCVTWAERYA